MTAYLLDTHVWLWSLIDPDKIGSQRSALQNERSELFLSPISIWEALLLGEKGRVKFDNSPGEWVRGALEASPVREAPLNNEIAFTSRALTLDVQDPADRFIVATALVFGLTLITADQALWKCREIAILKCR